MTRAWVFLAAGFLAGVGAAWLMQTGAQPALELAQTDAKKGNAATPDESCSRPAYLLVWIDQLDMKKSGDYGAALRKSQIVGRHGGEYLTYGSPARLLEGQWPKDRSIVIEQYPCLEQIEEFWYSDEYQNDIMPLRAGSGHYTVAAFEAYQPAPDRVKKARDEN